MQKPSIPSPPSSSSNQPNFANPYELAQMRDFTIIRANQTIEHIFSELYTVPEKIRFGYIRVKILELFHI